MWSFFGKETAAEFPYEIGEDVGIKSEVWELHKGKSRISGEEVSIFICRSSQHFDVAKAALKKVKTLRHPSIITYLDSRETVQTIYIVTEYVYPLTTYLREILKNEKGSASLVTSWGLFQIARGISFLNTDAKLSHNNVSSSSVYVNLAGDWKLANLECMTESPPPTIQAMSARENPPPECESRKKPTVSSTDAWGLGCLIYEIFNDSNSGSIDFRSDHAIPCALRPIFGKLTKAVPSARLDASEVLRTCRSAGGYFDNHLVNALYFLENIHTCDNPAEKIEYFSSLADRIDSFPDHICRRKILALLCNAMEYSNVGYAALNPLLKLGTLLTDESEYQRLVVPHVVKLFNCNDRATRFSLLNTLHQYVDHLQASTANEQIFPQIANGFSDTHATIREQTIKCMLYLAPKLDYNNLNVEMLKHFARLQSKDDQGSIRTNTTICMGKIAGYFHPQLRQKVLISAFVRAMRDPFPPARSAGVLALAATEQYYTLEEVSGRILPALCQLTLDPDRLVRQNVFSIIKGFLGKLEKVSQDPSMREQMEAQVNSTNNSGGNIKKTSTWASWAVSAVAAKFYKGGTTATASVDTTSDYGAKTSTSDQPKSAHLLPDNNFKENDDLNRNSLKVEIAESESSNENNGLSTENDGWDLDDWNNGDECFSQKVDEKSDKNGWENDDDRDEQQGNSQLERINNKQKVNEETESLKIEKEIQRNKPSKLGATRILKKNYE